MRSFAARHEIWLQEHVVGERASQQDVDAFRIDLDRAWSIGLERGMSGVRRLCALDPNPASAYAFLDFPRREPSEGRHTFVFVSQEYPPNRIGGIGRYVNQLTRAVASQGHQVHVLTTGAGHNRVDFEEGTWVHRVLPRVASDQPPGLPVPAHIWNNAWTMLSVLRCIAQTRQVDCVYAPIWDCEGIAILLDGTFPLVTGLQTTLRFWLESHPHIAADSAFDRDFCKTPSLKIETWILRHSDGIHAISGAIVWT